MYQPDELKREGPLSWSPGSGPDVWEMLRAARDGDLPAVERLLRKDPSLRDCSYEYRTPLSFAVRENRLEVAALLLERGASPLGFGNLLEAARERGHEAMERLLASWLERTHHVSPRGDALAAAIRERDRGRVRELLDASPEAVHAADERTNQPIHWAVMTRQIDLVDEFLARGADLEARRADGARPIQLTNGDYFFRAWRDVPRETAASPGEVLAHLRAKGAHVDICTAADIGDLERVRELLDADPSLANRCADYVTYYAGSGSPLRNAAGGGHVEIVRLLLSRGADPNLREEGIAPRGHALYAAVSEGSHEIARILLEAGADPTAPVESSADCMAIAVQRSDQRMVELLASYGGTSSLPILAYYGDVRTAAAALAANPALAGDPEALSYAATEGHEPFLRLLLRHRPEVARRVGVAAKTPALTELLFAHGMDPSYPDWLGVTPLHRVAKAGDLEVAALLIERGADLHALDDELRSTPLGWAARSGKVDMVELLLSRGASPSLPDDPPWAAPLAWAAARGHEKVVELLKGRQADPRTETSVSPPRTSPA